ncbi:tripartite tricarboxylate transporter substrate binding protein [Acidovorax sp. ACV02]|uniref:Bug family tripartite tricarboxylate transporter substrate binding protein n=1 Tax=Acidovorax sp. ACV02 TaxID=2769310 RepID=UPI001780D8E6|nr:tripartite tricarboxylate transporter substrate-binding protein [Acidovorax sp. ACV02]MBD9408396.1 tripartite tricarboxylate transporter substrate binding protein [Acidovorax sp. ACV02]
MSFRRFAWHAGIALALAGGLPPAAIAQDGAKAWPQQPVRFIVPTPPGAPVNIIVRLLQPKLQAACGQPVVMENKPGAGGNIGAHEVAQATDGHTILAAPDTVVTVNPHLYKKMGFDPGKDLVPVTYLASFNQMLVCNPRTGFGNLAALLRSTRKQPVTYASSGQGGPSHLAMELLLASTNSKIVHEPYRGPSLTAQDLVSGQVQCGFIASTVVLPFVKDGRQKGLAVSSGARSPQAPAIPTVAEDDVVGFDATFVETLQAPASLPKGVVDKVRGDVTKLLLTPEMKDRLLEQDLITVANTPAEASRRAAADQTKWGRIAKTMNLTLD